jgi:hypothetical protein
MGHAAPDPSEQGKRAAKEGILADANPYAAGTGDFALWKDGRGRQDHIRRGSRSGCGIDESYDCPPLAGC